MNSKFTSQILYSSFILLLIIVDSLQSPITEDKRATHKLLRFGRNPAHQLMHFGKRSPDSVEDDATNPNEPNEVSNDALDQNDERNLVYKILLEEINRKNSQYPIDNYLSMARRSGPNLFENVRLPKKYYFKKADNRDNVFMHFG